MIAITSIAPKHINGDIQKLAIDSWVALGFKVYSLNCKKEIESYGVNYPNVEFIESPTMEAIFSKPLIGLRTMLDFANSQEDNEICFINSDILLFDTFNVLPTIKSRLPNEATIVQRKDFINDINVNRTFRDGIDVFFVHKNYLHLIKDDGFAISQCWWDYTIPYSLMKENKVVYLLKEPLAYHRMHNSQYLISEWFRLGTKFGALHGIKSKRVTDIAQLSFDYIFTTCI